MMESACAHAENNIARLTKPFFYVHIIHKHMHSHTQAGMCTAQSVIMVALMWSLGGTEGS